MNDNLFKYISEYFNTFNHKDYTIYVNGKWTKWCSFNRNRVVWNIPSDSNERDWYVIYSWEIAEISITATSMTIKKINGGERTFVAKVKAKEEKAKDIILKTKNAIYTHRFDNALEYLDELNALMDE